MERRTLGEFIRLAVVSGDLLTLAEKSELKRLLNDSLKYIILDGSLNSEKLIYDTITVYGDEKFNKLSAVKFYKYQSGLGLKESKDIFDKAIDNLREKAILLYDKESRIKSILMVEEETGWDFSTAEEYVNNIFHNL